jgi:hypothetical protein
MELKMKFDGKVMAKIKNADRGVREVFAGSMAEASTEVMEASIREAPAATGNLRKSIRRELTNGGLRAEIFPSVTYGERLHGPFEGGSGYSRPFTIPAREAMPGGTLYRWGKKRGINPWAVRATIKKRGVKHNPYMRRAAKKTNSAVKEIFAGALRKLAENFGD